MYPVLNKHSSTWSNLYKIVWFNVNFFLLVNGILDGLAETMNQLATHYIIVPFVDS